MYPAKVACAIAVLLTDNPHGFSPVPHSQPTLAVLWTKLNIELKPTPYPITHNMAYIPDPTEKLQVSCSHTMPPNLTQTTPTLPLISTPEPWRKLADHTSIWATLNLKWGHQKKLITGIHINRHGD